MPNMTMGMGSGTDSNNYLDIRNENHYQDQGTARVDHVSRTMTPFSDVTR